MIHPAPRSLCAALLCAASLLAAPVRAEKIDLGNSLSLDFVTIPAGTFSMGSPQDEADRKPDEQLHDVTLDEFLITRTPITRAQFERFAQDANFRTEAERGNSGGYGVVNGALTQRKEFTWKNPGFTQGPDHPVVLVSFNDAQAFATWLSRRTGRKITLPSEAQWEYAARAGTTTRFYSGDENRHGEAIAWHKGNANNATHDVAGKESNAWGLFDMSGHVGQWCTDLYGPYVPGAPVAGDTSTRRNVLRGGSFLRDLKEARSAARYRATPGSRNADIGFRLVMAPRPSAQVELPAGAIPPPAGPSIPPAPQPTPPMQAQIPHMEPDNGSFGSMGSCMCLVCPCAVVLGIVGIIFAIVRRKNANASQPNPYAGPATTPPAPPRGGATIGQDGFWADTSSYNPGDTVRYRYRGPGGWVENEFTAEPGNQFVYTGVTPTSLMITGIVAAAAGDLIDRTLNTPPPIPPIPPATRPYNPPTTTRHYPSAY